MPTEQDQQEPGGEYGTSIALTETGGLKQNKSNKFSEIHDVKAVVQDLKVCLLTPRGADPLRPEYGLDILRRLGEDPSNPSAIGTSDAEFRVAVREAIGPRADDRVSTINQININRPDGDRSSVSITVNLTLEDGSRTQFSFSPNVTNA